MVDGRRERERERERGRKLGRAETSIFSKERLVGSRRRLKAEKTSVAARVSFVRDIRLLVGKMPTFYYGLF